MCGIFGFAFKNNLNNATQAPKIMDQLYRLSESRGKEAAGFVFRGNESIIIGKQPLLPSAFADYLKSQRVIKNLLTEVSQTESVCLFGHSRLVTNGSQESNNNNQPIDKKGVLAVHNGIITNIDELWSAYPEFTRQTDLDTEIISDLIRKFLPETNSLPLAIKKTFENLEGAASIALTFDDLPVLVLATNTGSLYVCKNESQDALIFASENYILRQLLKKSFLKNFHQSSIEQLRPGQSIIVALKNFKFLKFNYNEKPLTQDYLDYTEKLITKNIFQYTPDNLLAPNPSQTKIEDLKKTVNQNRKEKLIRCTKCVLPETFPGISFDQNGVCNICRNYVKKPYFSQDQLISEINKYRRTDGRPDCLVAFSGGRDSSYGLHYLKNVLKMSPIAFTYDWGMVTDLARRNQARICGRLGIEHIIVSANIKRKRNNIRKNVVAWLKKPVMGLIPLFMAGDKQFFYYANKLMKQNDLKLMVFCENERLENTKFKTGFCNVKEGNNRWANMPLLQKLKLGWYYLIHFFKNPAYFNSSLWDTLGAYLSTYLIKHDYLFLYRFLPWDESIINDTLISQYNWETAKDTKSTWRIGDGTAPFYNYIYHTVAGFTENDTFRSNQIREGLITRDEALKFIAEENKPRPDSIQWYCETINLDPIKTIKIINSIPKLYKQ